MPVLEALVGYLVAVADGHLDDLPNQGDVQIAAQAVALNLSTKLYRYFTNHGSHPHGYIWVITFCDFNILFGQQQCGIAILNGLDSLQFHIAYTCGGVSSLKNKVLEVDIIQSAVFCNRDDGILFRRHTVYGNGDGYVVVGCKGSNSCCDNQ